MDTRLAHETLSQIIGYLKDDQGSLLQINRTCKKLYELSIPYLFESPEFESFGCFEAFATTLTKSNGLHVRHIDLHMIPHRWDSFRVNNLLFTLSEKTPELELLNLDRCSTLTNKALIKITTPLHDLRVLSVDQCELIGDDSIVELVNNCPYIQKLYLGATHITDSSLILIATKLILLTHLNLRGCQYISELGVCKVTEECKTLRHIDIKHCYNVIGKTRFDEFPTRMHEGPVRTIAGSHIPSPSNYNLDEDHPWVDVDEEEQGQEGNEDDPPSSRICCI